MLPQKILARKAGIALGLCLPLLAQCSVGPNRIGYAMNKRESATCDIPVIREWDARYDRLGRTLGRLQIGGRGSAYCDEARALEIARKDGCSLGADVIVVNSEQRDSACYRAEYEFYAMDSAQWRGGAFLVE